MNRRKVIATLSAVAVAATMFVGCGGSSNSSSNSGASGTKLKVGLVTDQGGVNDGSFNESANRGIEQAEGELGIQKLNAIESKSVDVYEPNLKTMSSQADLTVGAGFMMQQAMDNVSKQAADKKFVVVDTEVKNPNVQSIFFKEQEGSFLAGVMAGKLTKTNKIGFVGGKEGEVINRFEAGFVAGVASVNPEAAKGLMAVSETQPGKFVTYVDSFDDQQKGVTAAKKLYQDGADIVMHAAGGVGLGVFKAAEEMGKFAIGVDSDQAVAASSKGYKDVILFSMEKKVDVAVKNVIKQVQDGNFKGGETQVLGIKEGGVGIAPTLHENVTKEAQDLTKRAEQLIKDDKIAVPGTRAELLKFQPVEIK